MDKPNRVLVRDVIEATAACIHASPGDVLGHDRSFRLVRPRQIAMLVARRLTGQSLIEVSQRMRRDHSTIIHGERRISRLLDGGDVTVTALVARISNAARARAVARERHWQAIAQQLVTGDVDAKAV